MSMRAYDVRNSLSYNKVFDNGVRTQELNVLGGVQAKFAKAGLSTDYLSAKEFQQVLDKSWQTIGTIMKENKFN